MSDSNNSFSKVLVIILLGAFFATSTSIVSGVNHLKLSGVESSRASQ